MEYTQQIQMRLDLMSACCQPILNIISHCRYLRTHSFNIQTYITRRFMGVKLYLSY